MWKLNTACHTQFDSSSARLSHFPTILLRGFTCWLAEVGWCSHSLLFLLSFPVIRNRNRERFNVVDTDHKQTLLQKISCRCLVNIILPSFADAMRDCFSNRNTASVEADLARGGCSTRPVCATYKN